MMRCLIDETAATRFEIQRQMRGRGNFSEGPRSAGRGLQPAQTTGSLRGQRHHIIDGPEDHKAESVWLDVVKVQPTGNRCRRCPHYFDGVRGGKTTSKLICRTSLRGSKAQDVPRRDLPGRSADHASTPDYGGGRQSRCLHGDVSDLGPLLTENTLKNSRW
jgi:hypothetical protein